MRYGPKMRVGIGLAIAGLAFGVYSWSVLGAFGVVGASAEPGSGSSAVYAYQYQYPSSVTGSGTILTGKAAVSFGFNARADLTSASGSCDVRDRTNRVHCLTVTSLAVLGTHGTFSGTASHNGATTTYTIDIDDLGEPAVGGDRFAITTG